MAPLGCLGRLSEKPAGEKLIEICGKVKFTGMKIVSSTLQSGKVAIYDNKGKFSIVVQSKIVKKFKLSDNVKQVTTRNDNFTLVLNDGYQVITKECQPQDVKDLENCIQSIKNGRMWKGISMKRPNLSSSVKRESSHFKDIKENVQLKDAKEQRGQSPQSSPLSRKGRNSFLVSPSSGQTPSRTPLKRKHSSATKSFEIIESRTSPLKPKVIQIDENSPTPRSFKAELSGEETTHKTINKTPNSFYGASNSVSTPLFSGRMKRKFGDGYFKSSSASRLPLQSCNKEKPRSYAFHRKEKETNRSPADQAALTGFANLGNTCYMNAILQCILGIPTFAQDLDNARLIGGLTYNSLYRCLYNLMIAKRSSENQDRQRYLLKNIKRAISNQAARFSGYMQHDAHEFLGQCLDQLKEDTIKLIASKHDDAITESETEAQMKKEIEAACPVSRNFECGIKHTIECTNCGGEITREEMFHDFSLDIPEIDENTNPEDKDLQDLLQDYFQDESVGYKCEECGCGDANLSHRFSKLPRVIILHLKRYGLDADSTRYRKKLDTVDVPIELDLGVLCTEKTANPPLFEKIAVTGTKRSSSAESICLDDDDFQPSLKARRKLSLPLEPRLTDPESGDTFDKDIAEATKMSLEDLDIEHATEDEQLEWALNESIRAGSNSPFSNSDQFIDLPSALLNIYQFEEDETNNGNNSVKERKNQTNFTSVQRRTESNYDGEKSEVEIIDKATSTVVNGDHSGIMLEKKKDSKYECNFFSNDENDNTDDDILLEGVSVLETEEEQLKLALEKSLHEYDESTAKSAKCETKNQEKTKPKIRKTSQMANVAPKKYRLLGIVSHIGDRSNMGHYISDVFDCKQQEWKSFNDSAVKKVTEYEVRYGRKRCAYIYFYINEECFTAINQIQIK